MFNISLKPTGVIPVVDEISFIASNMSESFEEVNRIDGLLFMICDIFDEYNVVSFEVSGFGHEKWPVDCTDLSCVVEQMDLIQRSIKSGIFDFNLDFYEQGMELSINFKDNKTIVDADCICSSPLPWLPHPISETITKSELESMFDNFCNTFLTLSKEICPYISSNAILQDYWADLRRVSNDYCG